MTIFILLILWVVFGKALCTRIAKKNPKKIYCFSVFVATTLITGLRSIYIGGVDTSLVYFPAFRRVMTFSKAQFIGRYGYKDIVYHIMTKVYTLFNTNFNLYIFLIAMFCMACVSVFIYRYSELPAFSYIIFFALGYYAATFQLLRHWIALSILLFAYPALKEKTLARFIFIVLLATLFHTTIIIFLIAYPLAHLKVGYKQWIGIAVVFAICYQAKGILRYVLAFFFSENERFSKFVQNDYSVQLSVVPILILLIVYGASYLLCNSGNKRDSEMTVLFNMSALSICFMSFVLFIGDFWRISMFFGIYNILLLPKSVTLYCKSKKHNKNDAKIFLLIFSSVMIAYFLFIGLNNYNLSEYRFFWQD